MKLSRRQLLLRYAVIGAALSEVHAEQLFPRSTDHGWPQKPFAFGSSAQFAPAGEPGSALEILCQAFDEAGNTPASDLIVYAYQTDVTGLYRADSSVPDWPERPPKLSGATRSDGDGKFRFTTIRPAPYPHRTNPAHVHFVIWWPDGHRQGDTLWFDDDPLVTLEMRARDKARSPFEHICSIILSSSIPTVVLKFRKHDERDDTW